MTGPIDAISSVTAGAAAPATPASSTATTSVFDPQTFLKLLVAQLSHQDPLNPTDSSTYIAEEAQFAMVQTMNTMNQLMTNLYHDMQTSSAVALIGKTVTYTASDGTPATGVVAAAMPGSNGPMLRIGSTTVPLSAITEVTEPAQ
jgi:flagellar basal-body rod modification protein FlgD